MMRSLKIFAMAALGFLAACGGGGGSSGSTSEPYSITLRSVKAQLPLNISHQVANLGAYAPYTTTLYVEARQGALPVPGGTEVFGCNIVQGLDSGALYYLDGKAEHEDENKNPKAYRSVALDANTGAASFHFHAGDQAGTARIICSITDPRDKQIRSASVDIAVGGNANGKPASVRAVTQAPGFLGSRDNLWNLRNNVGLQAFLMDDANQPVPNASAANLQVSIRPFGASAGARLLSGAQSGSVLQVNTSGGVGSFSLSSGANSGIILLELVTDRFDNNVANGIQDAVYSLTAVSVVDAVAATPLTFAATDINVPNTLPFAYALSATGGVAPYTWSATGSLPPGLALNSSGVIAGTPLAAPGDYNIAVTVVDAVGARVTSNLKLTVAGALPLDPLVFTVNGCGGDVNVACPLPSATGDSLYQYAFSASGGDPTKGIAWTISATKPTWLSVAQVGNNGVISGKPPVPATATDCVAAEFFVTATQAPATVTRKVSIKVTGGVCP
ncbi:Ig family protein [Acidovorax delafieldii 2AN]|uniref:Ig family protein n=2 Tax=Acidovorax delafieldii TaxID=47920 RepID=C5SZR3_ACIDE|nr:Ig family protein [Acidovorax delafieldii 2AN]